MKPAETVLKYVLAAAAVGYLAMYLFVALSRLAYPFSLEWMEGGAVDHVRWILAGRPLYGRPTLEFVAYAYTPLYYYLGAAVAYVLGVWLMPLRLISFLASLGCLAVIYLWVRRETGAAFFGLLSAGMFAAMFRAGGAWFDLARVDTLFLLFLLLALYTLPWMASSAALGAEPVDAPAARRHERAWLASSAAAGLWLVLAFQTKQTALVVALPLMAYALAVHGRRATAFVGVAGLGTAGSVWALNSLYGGWYNYYVFDLPRRHSIVPHMWLDFWLVDIFLALFVVSLVTLAFGIGLSLAKPGQDSGSGKRRLWFYVAAFAGMLAASWGSRLSDGGYNNVLLPAYAMLSVGFGLGVHQLLAWTARWRAPRGSMANCYLFLLCLIQFLTLRYDPLAQIPSRADLDSGYRAIQQIAQLEGDVFIPYCGGLSAMAGKLPYASAMGLFDVIGWDRRSEAAQALSAEVRRALTERRFGALILNEPQDWFERAWLPETTTFYSPTGQLFDDPTVFWPVTGMRTRPQVIYLPAEARTQTP